MESMEAGAALPWRMARRAGMQKRNASWTRVRDSQSREGGFDLAVTSHGFLAQCHAHGAHGRSTSATTETPIFRTTHPQEIIIMQGKRN
jgi:hypothetical protein